MLTAATAIAAAVGNHPQLRAARSAIRRQQHLRYQATRRPNPTAGYLAAEVGNEADAGQQGLFLSQEFVRGDKLTLDGQIRFQEMLLEQERLRLRQLRIEADVRFAVIEVAYAQEQQKLLQRLQQSLDNAVSAVNTLVRSGELSSTAALQSRLEAQRNLMKTARTKAALATAQQALAAVVGWKSFAAPVDVSVLRPDLETDDTLRWDRIQSSSPELAVVRAQQQVARARVCREQAEPIPNLQTQWSLQQDAATDYTVLGIQLGVELPVRDRNRGAISAAHAETWRFQNEAEAITRDLKTRYVRLAGEARQAELQLKTIKGDLESLALQNVSTTQRAFRLGEATYLDLLNAQRAYVSLSLETLELYRQLALIGAAFDALLVSVPPASR
ncbi:MAG: TolC family protein [Planctomycetaceae bacterium]|nr:TolC family protein [Planctomycetaceae bacterium]